MDDYVEDFEEVDDFIEASEVDLDYEFDAAQYFDFCRPENFREAQEAERWFSFAGNYPASPLVVKFRWGGGILRETKITTYSLAADNTNDTCSKDSTSKGREGVVETKEKAKSSSSLMKPTVSHLAKLKQARDILLSNQLCGRLHKSPIGMDGKSLKQGFDNLATKRQKLELGYMRRGSCPKHQALLLHKLCTKVQDGNKSPNAAYPKLKVSIPKEPALETQQRAKSRRSRTNSESGHSELESANRKIFKPPSPTVKSKRRLTAIQAFNFETSARALQRSSTSDLSRHDSVISSRSGPPEYKRSNTVNALKKKNERKSVFFSSKVHPTKEGISSELKNINKTTESKLEREKRISGNPPTNLFKKLSIRSKSGSDTVPQPNSLESDHDSKENAPDTSHPDFWKCVGKMNQCRNVKAIAGIANQSINRSLGIH